MRSKISLMAPRSPSSALAASLRAISRRTLLPSPSTLARESSLSSASRTGLVVFPPSGGASLMLMAPPLGDTWIELSGGPRAPRYRTQGRHPPADAARSRARRGIEEKGALYLCQDRLFPRSVRERRAHPHRALRCGTGPITRKHAEIRDRRNQRALIILQTAKRKIAATAQQASYHAGQMAMIDAEPFLRAPSTDRTGAVLLFQQRVVLGGRYTVLTYMVMRAIALADLILVRLVVGAIPRVFPGANLRVLPSLLLPRVFRCALFRGSRHALSFEYAEKNRPRRPTTCAAAQAEARRRCHRSKARGGVNGAAGGYAPPASGGADCRASAQRSARPTLG